MGVKTRPNTVVFGIGAAVRIDRPAPQTESGKRIWKSPRIIVSTAAITELGSSALNDTQFSLS